MALTVVRHSIKNETGEQNIGNIAFKTAYSEELDSVYCKVYQCDNELKPLSKSRIFEVCQSEADYHKELRIQACKYNHLITSLSTNPEWNPENYNRNLEEFLKDENPE